MGKWIASILATIISGVVVYWLTVGSDRHDHRLETLSPSAGVSKTDTTPAPDSKTIEAVRKLEMITAELAQVRSKVASLERQPPGSIPTATSGAAAPPPAINEREARERASNELRGELYNNQSKYSGNELREANRESIDRWSSRWAKKGLFETNNIQPQAEFR